MSSYTELQVGGHKKRLNPLNGNECAYVKLTTILVTTDLQFSVALALHIFNIHVHYCLTFKLFSLQVYAFALIYNYHTLTQNQAIGLVHCHAIPSIPPLLRVHAVNCSLPPRTSTPEIRRCSSQPNGAEFKSSQV